MRDSVAAWHAAEIESLARPVVGSDKPGRRRLCFLALAGLLVRERSQPGGGSAPQVTHLRKVPVR